VSGPTGRAVALEYLNVISLMNLYYKQHIAATAISACTCATIYRGTARLLAMKMPSNFRNSRVKRTYAPFPLVLGLTVAILAYAALVAIDTKWSTHIGVPSYRVYSAFNGKSVITKNQQQHLFEGAQAIFLDPTQQRTFVRRKKCGFPKFQELMKREQGHLATELWKWCALANEDSTAIYLDFDSPLVKSLDDILNEQQSVAVLGHDEYFPETVHGSLIILQSSQLHIARKILNLILETPIDVLVASPLLISRALYASIQSSVKINTLSNYLHRLHGGNNGDQWLMLQQKCRMDPLRRMSKHIASTTTYKCPPKTEFCCSVVDPKGQVVLLNRHPQLPCQVINNDNPKPLDFAVGFYGNDELPYISSLKQKMFARPEDFHATPNFYDVLLKKDRLPDEHCLRCMHMRLCEIETMEQQCSDYFQDVCGEKTYVVPKFVSKQVTITPPYYSRDPSRIIPRIIHQTWYENITIEEYPNMSRLVESWKNSGWEYKFYSDAVSTRVWTYIGDRCCSSLRFIHACNIRMPNNF
jgi:hypothetical protein